MSEDMSRAWPSIGEVLADAIASVDTSRWQDVADIIFLPWGNVEKERQHLGKYPHATMRERFSNHTAHVEATRSGEPDALVGAFYALVVVSPEAALIAARHIAREATFERLDMAVVGILLDAEEYSAVEHRFAVSPAMTALPRGESLAIRAAEVSEDHYVLSSLIENLSKISSERCPAGLKRLVRHAYLKHVGWRVAAGHTLIDFGDPESLDFLATHRLANERWARTFGVKAVFVRDPMRAYDVLSPDLSSDNLEFAWEVVKCLDSNAKAGSATKYDYDGPNGERWVTADQRWALVLAHWRKTRDIGAWTKSLLERYPAEVVAKATAQADALRGKPSRAKKTKVDLKKIAELPARYAAGEHAAVWTALGRLGERVREGPAREPAEEVARLAMLRVRENLETLVVALRNAGYQFKWPEQALEVPVSDAEAKLKTIEEWLGPLPLVLRAFYLHVGACDLSGWHPDWKPTHVDHPAARALETKVPWKSDPLVVAPLSRLLDDASDHPDPAIPFTMGLCPDALGKAGYSAGEYTLHLPGTGIDAVVHGGPKERPFLDHLRHALKKGGFPGLARLRNPPVCIAELEATYRPF